MKTPAPANYSDRPSDKGVPQFVDLRSLMAIRNLEFRARVVVEGFWNGLHRSPYHGFSVEFSEYRQYCPGDDPRYLDWRLYGRTDRYFIKKFEDETNLRCYLLVDASRSMSFGSLSYTKSEYARTLAATLGYFLDRQGDAVGLMTFHEKVCEYLPARHRPGQLRQLMLALDRPAGGKSTDLADALDRAAGLARKRSLLVLISDLLSPLDTLARRLGSLAAAGHEILIFQLLDPAELLFSFSQATTFEDLESGRQIYTDPGQMREAYLNRLKQHNRQVEQICQNLGIAFLPFDTRRPLELALFDFLSAQNQRGRRILRRNRA